MIVFFHHVSVIGARIQGATRFGAPVAPDLHEWNSSSGVGINELLLGMLLPVIGIPVS